MAYARGTAKQRILRMTSHPTYLAFDPGETTGAAVFDQNGEVMRLAQLKFDELVEFLENYADAPIIVVVCEQFKLFKHKAKSFAGSRMETSQAEGVIRGFASRLGAEFVLQAPDRKPIAQRWTQIFPPSDHALSHQVDAFNHGAYYLINKGVRKSYLEEQEAKNDLRKL